MGSRIRRIGLISVLALVTACASLKGRESARSGDFTALRKTLEKEHLEATQVRELAQEVLIGEVTRAKDLQDRPFVSSLGPCARPLESALERRAKTHDGVGAEAALLLVEGGRLSGRAKRFAREKDGAWRALSARTAKEDDDLRRAYFEDDDERVRRAALSAALEVADPGDTSALLDVARLDPDPLSRSRAYQSLGRIGGDDVALALKDRFALASEELRLAIVDAWSQPALYGIGGRQQLLGLLDRDGGFDVLHAASTISNEKDATWRSQGLARLLRFAREGTQQERRLALQLLPRSSSETTAMLLVSIASEDQHVAVIAAARLLAHPSHRDRAQKALLSWAASDSPVAFEASSALSAAGDDRILPLMKSHLMAKAPQTRRVAGYALVRLGAFSDLAPLLADEDPDVRRSVACRTLARPPLPVK